MTKSSLTGLYIFILGREQEIALAELEAVLNRFGCHAELDSASYEGIPKQVRDDQGRFVFDRISVSGNVAAINIEKGGDCDVVKLIDILGGTIKIFRIASSVISTSTSVIPAPYRVRGKLRQGSLSQLNRSRIKSGMTENKNKDNQVESITDIIVDHCKNNTGKFNFGLSDYTGRVGRQKINSIGLEVKKELKNRGFRPRFVALRDEKELSSIVSLKNNLVDKGIEIGIFTHPRGVIARSTPGVETSVGVLIALNNPEEWSRRDYGKPAGDKYSGMTPPKLARMLINITLGLRVINPKSEIRNPKQIPNPKFQSRKSLNLDHSDFDIISDLDIRNSDFHDSVVVDPFCGSGNILMEAMMLGCEAIGSDISEKAIIDTEANLDWLTEQILNSKSKILNKLKIQNPNVKIFQTDATNEELIENCKLKIENYDPVVIVTEPYLGEPKKFAPSMRAVMGEYTKVKQIYLDFLKNVAILNRHCEPAGRGNLSNTKIALSQAPRNDNNEMVLAVIFPLVETSDNKRFSLYRECVDEIKSLGYIETRPPLIYGREYQVVKREIVFLKFKI